MWSSYIRLFRYVGPFTGLLLGSIVLMVVSAVLDAFSLVLLIPFLQSLFGVEILTGADTSSLEQLLDGWFGVWLRSSRRKLNKKIRKFRSSLNISKIC